MSTKITYKQLTEQVEEKSDHSQSFIRNFLDDLTKEIRAGLQSDGKVNIAHFGKFELQQVDEKEGYNPQTEEKMMIPAHKKARFKPSKDLREAVNAPFSHFEPRIIDEDQAKENKPFFPIEPEERNVTDKKEGSSQVEKQQTGKSRPIPHPLKNYTGWLGAGLAFLAASAGAWFYFRKDE